MTAFPLPTGGVFQVETTVEKQSFRCITKTMALLRVPSSAVVLKEFQGFIGVELSRDDKFDGIIPSQR